MKISIYLRTWKSGGNCWVKNQTSPFPKGPMDGSKAQNNQGPHRASIQSLRSPRGRGHRGPRVLGLRGPRIRGLRGPRIRGLRGLDIRDLGIWESRVRNHLNVMQYDLIYLIRISSIWKQGNECTIYRNSKFKHHNNQILS